MTVLKTAAGRFVASHKHSVAMSDGRYLFSDEIVVGDEIIHHSGMRAAVKEVSREKASGLYAPLTEHSNYFAGETEDSMVLAHSFAHMPYPHRFERALHKILDVAEFLWPSVHDLTEGNGEYVHPVMKRLARLIGIY